MPKKKNRAAAQLGKRGGKARAKKLSPKERTESARKAAQERWKLVQRRRIEGLVTQSAPRAKIHWDKELTPDLIRFSVDSGSVNLLASSGHLRVSEIAKKTDDELKALLNAWSGGKL